MNAPHKAPEFANSTEYTVSITFRVEGGAREQTATRRARKIAERLVNHAARAGNVIEVTAVGGVSEGGRPLSTERLPFAAANTGHATNDEPSKLDRYLDPEFERGLDSLAEANAAAPGASEIDRHRRQTLGCLNTTRSATRPLSRCLCVYCAPVAYEHAVRRAEAGAPHPLVTPRCICGRAVAAAGLRCVRHHSHELVVLDGDPPALQRLGRRQRGPEPRDPGREPPPPGRGIDGPELPPAGR